jgi:hypothetical protein
MQTTTTTAYRAFGVKPHYAGFGMWDVESDSSELYDSIADLFESVEFWTRDEFEAAGIEDISGRIYNEHGELYAWRDNSGEINYNLVVEEQWNEEAE